MITVTVEHGDAVIADLSGIQRGATRAAVRALNKAIASGKTEMKRLVASDTGLPAKAVSDAMPVRNATTARLEAAFGAKLKRIPLMDFRATGPVPSRGKGRGVSYKLGGSRNRVPNAFIATMTSGHTGVFVRKGTRRTPIHELFGPSLGHVFAKYRAAGLARTKEAFETYFEHEMKRITDKQAGA